MNTLNRIHGIFCEIFDDKTFVFTRETSSDDIEGWDSLAQINIIVACESEFGIKFGLNDIPKLKNVESIVDIIERKLKK